MRLVASAYEPVSRRFMERTRSQLADESLGSVVDLGCGPGYSTRLLGEVFQPRRLTGVDSSEEVLGVARSLNPGATFVTHDVMTTPLPGTPAEVIYARLLLAHLPEPAERVEAWLGNLTDGGVVVIEDLEDVEAPAGPLARYEEISAAIVQSAGGVMYAGRRLAELGGAVTRVTVSAADAARIYGFNVRRWRADPPPASDPAELADLEEHLDLIAAGRPDGHPTSAVSWVVRQLALHA